MEFNGHASEANDGALYWVDPATGAATWERPAPYAWAITPSKEHPESNYYYNSVRDCAPAGQRVARRGAALICARYTYVSARGPPDARAAPARAPAPPRQVTQETTWEKPAILGWKARRARQRALNC